MNQVYWRRLFKAEKIEIDDFNNKKPLQRAVQLIKRSRDIYFQEDDSYKTRSIILTTIAGQFYSGEESIFGTIDNVITKIQEELKFHQQLKIYNPVNRDEEFTDKWKFEPKYYEEFKLFVIHLYTEWQKFKKENGIIEEAKIFKGLFGEKLVERVQLRESEMVGGLRKNGGLGIIKDTGVLSNSFSSQNTSIHKNTFYGN